jgi:hypothetical protein
MVVTKILQKSLAGSSVDPATDVQTKVNIISARVAVEDMTLMER